MDDRSVWERPATFAVERRRGWTETADTPARAAGDVWDEGRADRVTMEKPRPRSRMRLRVRGRYAAFRSLEPGPVAYEVVDGDEVTALEGVQWAEWDADGRLLVATRPGRLEVRDGARPAQATPAHADLAALAPAPEAPPPEAAQW